MPTAFAPRGQAIDVAIKAESSYGVAPTGNWTLTPIYSHTLEERQPYEDDHLLGQPRHNDRDPLAPAPGLPVLAGEIVVPVDFAHLGFWLHMAFGSPTTTGTAPNFTHTYASGKEVLPHYALQVKHASNDFRRYLGLAAAALGFDVQKAAGHDRLTLNVIGKSESKLTASGAGTPPAFMARVPVHRALPVVKIAGTVAGAIISGRGEYRTGAVPQDFLGDIYPFGHDLDDMPAFSGQITARYRDAAIYDLARAQGAQSLEILWEISASRSLSLLAPACRLAPFGVPVSGPGGTRVTFDFRAEQTAGAAMVTAVLKSPTQSF